MVKNTKATKNEKIICKCYGTEQEFSSRSKAKKFYLECIAWSEGAERDRYVNILLDLEDGKNYCTDEEEW